MTAAWGVVRRSLALVGKHRRASAWAIAAIAAALVGVAATRLAAQDVAAWSHGARAQASMVVYLDEGATPAQADALVRLVRDVPCKFNLIPFNPFPGTAFAVSPRGRILAFQRRLMDAGIVTTIRKTRGEDIDAACGQLAGLSLIHI